MFLILWQLEKRCALSQVLIYLQNKPGEFWHTDCFQPCVSESVCASLENIGKRLSYERQVGSFQTCQQHPVQWCENGWIRWAVAPRSCWGWWLLKAMLSRRQWGYMGNLKLVKIVARLLENVIGFEWREQPVSFMMSPFFPQKRR